MTLARAIVVRVSLYTESSLFMLSLCHFLILLGNPVLPSAKTSPRMQTGLITLRISGISIQRASSTLIAPTLDKTTMECTLVQTKSLSNLQMSPYAVADKGIKQQQPQQQQPQRNCLGHQPQTTQPNVRTFLHPTIRYLQGTLRFSTIHSQKTILTAFPLGAKRMKATTITAAPLVTVHCPPLNNG